MQFHNLHINEYIGRNIMKYLENCQPAEVFEYFEEICQIPHESGNTAKIAAYLVSFAEKHGLDHYMDDFNNVIIRKPASAGYAQ